MNVNKVLIVFLGVVGLMTFGVWEFAHTERFAHFVSSRMKESIFKNFKGDISFQSIEIGIFPLSTRVKNFHLKTKTLRGQDVYCRFDEVGFYFSFFDLFSSSLSVDKVSIENGAVQYVGDVTPSRSSRDPFRIEKIFSLYKQKDIGKFLQSIKAFRLKNTNVFDFVQAGNLDIRTYKNYIVLAGKLDRVNIGKIYSKRNKIYENVDIELEVERTGVRVKNLKVKDELEVVTFKGEIEELARGHKIEGDVRFRGRMKRIFQFLDMKFLERQKMLGYVDANVNITGNIKRPTYKIAFQGEKIETPYFIADKMEGEGVIKSGKISVSKADLKRKGGTLSLLEPVDIFDIPSNKFIPNRTQFEVGNFFTNEMFRALDFMDDVKGRVNGLFDVEWSEKSIVFMPSEGAYFEKVRLESERGGVPIIKNERMTFYGGEFVVEYGDRVDVDVDVGFEGCRFRGERVRGRREN